MNIFMTEMTATSSQLDPEAPAFVTARFIADEEGALYLYEASLSKVNFGDIAEAVALLRSVYPIGSEPKACAACGYCPSCAGTPGDDCAPDNCKLASFLARHP